MDDESIRQHLHIDVASNSTPSSDHKNRLSNLVIIIVICVVMVCGVTFAAIILERGADLENKVHSQETQLLLVKKIFEKILRRKSNSSFTSRVITDPKNEARKYNGPFGYATKRVKQDSFSEQIEVVGSGDGYIDLTRRRYNIKKIGFCPNVEEKQHKRGKRFRYYTSNTSIEEEHQVFFTPWQIFQTITNIIVRDSQYTGHPVGHWTVKSKSGNISLYSSTYLKIKTPGLYQVYTQVYFFDNFHSTRSVDLLVKQNNKVIAKCLVPVATCREGCTRYLWRMVKLKENDYLSVQSSNNIRIMMSENMSFFGANLLKDL